MSFAIVARTRANNGPQGTPVTCHLLLSPNHSQKRSSTFYHTPPRMRLKSIHEWGASLRRSALTYSTNLLARKRMGALPLSTGPLHLGPEMHFVYHSDPEQFHWIHHVCKYTYRTEARIKTKRISTICKPVHYICF